MVVNTSRLFRRLLRTLEVETVCDIGCMDGSDALRFRQILPHASIIALEPNPRNFALMEAEQELADKSICILPLAASDRASEEPFYVGDADYTRGRDRFRRGMSSLHRRFDGSQLAEIVQVRTVRLDELLAARSLDERPIALWIDTEGMAFEVVKGAEAVLPSVRMLHVEVETEAIIGAEQKLFRHVEDVLKDSGFTLLATDQPRRRQQFNALFIRADLLRSKAVRIGYWTTVMLLRYAVVHTALWILPRRLRYRLLYSNCRPARLRSGRRPSRQQR